MKKIKLTALEKSWILYDIGNSAFVLLISTIIPIYFGVLFANSGKDSALELSYWGYADTIATVLVAVIAPVFGTMSDRKGYKKPIFTICLCIGAVGCAALGFVSSWLVFLIVLILGQVGLNSSFVFYDSMLPEIASENNMDNISTMGYAYGYIGSVIPFIACLVLALMPDALGLSSGTGMTLVFLLTALWWSCCSIPLIKNYRQTAYVERRGNAVYESFRQLAHTFRNAQHNKPVFVYLIAFFFFINGVHTIIKMATSYGSALGLDSTGLLLALLVTQIVAFPCAIIFGRLSAKHDSGKLIKLCILAYTGITLFAMTLMTLWQFWLLAILVGMFQGAIQALSRSYLGKIIPPEQSGEYYGLMDICGKGAAALGTMLVSTVNLLTRDVTVNLFGLRLNNSNLSVGALVILFIIGYFLFCKADRLNKK